MRVELGNARPADPRVPGPTVTEFDPVPPIVTFGASGKELGQRFAVTERLTHQNAGGHTAFLTVLAAWHHGGTPTNSGGPNPHGIESPSWVKAIPAPGEPPEAAQDLERQLAENWGCARGYPADLEATHHTRKGPPGVGVEAP